LRPIRTETSNFTYLGFEPQIADLPCRRDDGKVYAVYALTDEEREMIANGGQVQLGIYSEPIPPISMTIVNEAEAAAPTQDGIPVEPDYRCERCDGLYVSHRAIELELKCGFCNGDLRLPGAAA
jgi:hypothetical protein